MVHQILLYPVSPYIVESTAYSLAYSQLHDQMAGKWLYVSWKSLFAVHPSDSNR